jgi:hypothetical protein
LRKLELISEIIYVTEKVSNIDESERLRNKQLSKFQTKQTDSQMKYRDKKL